MAIQRRRFLRGAGVAAALGLAGCVSSNPLSQSDESGDETESQQSPEIGDDELTLATTTSTYDTGLLDELHPPFEEAFGITVKTLAKGTGASIRTAEDGDADVILVHARGAEDEFLQEGYGVNRRDVMFNDFVVAGSEDDPAGIEGMESATDAFAAIANSGETFVSRGDDSGTNKKELAVWDESGVEPGGEWYQEVGKGMGDTLVQTNQIGGYTIADRGTYLSMRDEIDLAILVQGPLEGGPTILKNPYGVIPVNPEVHGNANYEAAMAYVGFLTSPRGQDIIDSYTENGSQLFFPSALGEEANFGQYVPQGYSAEQADSLSKRDRQFLYWVDTHVSNDY
ncbi:substrate-binding domain-containing protein [Halorussus amylolyticus]|uniref:substrate-binding domain-containing protein n=1 Tax=Halorussus amylolyticus TaxID=1126242 RepID=UPI0010497675|nr:substrate-binding domain-containing protein [Halorussus amylolyticus]